MTFIVCSVPVCPLRAEAAHRSEMVSQLLFGESGDWLEESGQFIKIRCHHDGYEGWCQRSQLVVTDVLPISRDNLLFTGRWMEQVLINGLNAFVPMGCPVPMPGKPVVHLGPYTIQYPGENSWNAATAQPSPEAIRLRAFQLLNTPYLWGGRSVFGIDCSGFTQLVFRFFNIPLLRDAYLQATQGEGVGFLQEARCGDLAFFDNEEGRITHVGILLNDHEIIHASGNVRIDKIDNAGVVNVDTRERTHRLRIVRRYWGEYELF